MARAQRDDVAPAFIGEGSYGCVVQPPEPCISREVTNGRSSGPAVVAKIMTRQNAFEKEWQVAHVAAAIDPKQKHIIYPTMACEIAKPAGDDPRMHMCDFQDSSAELTHFYQLRMTYGGPDLEKFMKTSTCNGSTFLKIMKSALAGAALFAKAGYCHQDIKANNIVVKNDRAMLIDNNLSQRLKHLFTKQNARRLNHEYFIHPPEYRLAILTLKLAETDDPDFGAYRSILRNISQIGRPEFFSIFHDRTQFQIDALECFKWMKGGGDLTEYADRMDVYSLGVTVIDMWRHIKFTADERVKLVPKLVDLIRLMTSADPRKRPTPSGAYRRWSAMSKKMEK